MNLLEEPNPPIMLNKWDISVLLQRVKKKKVDLSG